MVVLILVVSVFIEPFSVVVGQHTAADETSCLVFFIP